MRTLSKFALLGVALAVLGGAFLVGENAKPTGAAMADSAKTFLGLLDADQKKIAAFDYDSEHRTTWYFTPQQDKDKQPLRKGLRLEKMNEKQKAAVLELLKVGLSEKGFSQASAIMDLENLLAELEGKNGAMTRNPTWYFVSIFGEPSNTGKWGWRVEGHHLSINLTLEKGQVVSATPVVFGSNPAEIKAGPNKGKRTLPEIEDLAKELIGGLKDDQVKAAKLAKQLPEIAEKQSNAGVGAPPGIPATKLSDDQSKLLMKLIQAYADRLPTQLAEQEMKRATDAGLGKIYFAYCIEDDKPGKPWTYRIQGPTFAIEFLNTQADAAKNPANHIHSGWRTLPNDFALPAK